MWLEPFVSGEELQFYLEKMGWGGESGQISPPACIQSLRIVQGMDILAK